MSNIWLTADTHFNHNNIREYCNRPFSSVEEMDAVLLENWNSHIKANDQVYFLGDLSFHPKEWLQKLNGNIHFVFGNHDKKKYRSYIRSCSNVMSCHNLLSTHIDDIDIILCHYALRVWHKSHFNSWHLFGHSHGRLLGWGKSFDVGVDSWDFKPVNWEVIKETMAGRPDNINFVEKE